MNRRSDELLSVGDVSRRTGVAVSALHYYEQLGLISSQRTAGNQRRYPRHMIRRVSLILVSRRLGISLADVREAFSGLPHDRAPSPRDWARISRRWDDRLAAKRFEIEQLRRELLGCIGCGCLSMTSCTLLNAQDVLGGRGRGPLRLGTDHLELSAGAPGGEPEDHRADGDLTDDEWARLRPLLPEPEPGGRGRRRRDQRQVVDGILWRTRTRAPWRDLPERYGPWQTCYERYRRWVDDGTWPRVLDHLHRPGAASAISRQDVC